MDTSIKQSVMDMVTNLVSGIPRTKSCRSKATLEIKNHIATLQYEESTTTTTSPIESHETINPFELMSTLKSASDNLSHTTPTSKPHEIKSPQQLVIKLPAKDLLTKLKLCKNSMAYMDVRFYLNGMLLDIRDGKVFLVSTSGHALSCIELAATTEKDGQYIIPDYVINKIIHLLKGGAGEAAITLYKKDVKFEYNGYCIESALIDANFPEYKHTISTYHTCIFTAPTKDIKGATSDVLLDYKQFNNKKMHQPLFFSITDNVVVESKHTSEHCENNVEPFSMTLPVGDGAVLDELIASFDAVLFRDMMQHVKAKDVKLFFEDSSSPINMSFDADYYNVFVLMPCRA